MDAVGSTEAQAFTIRDHPGFAADTTDGRARIFFNSSAFRGGKLSLREVLVHELIHVAGIDAGRVGFFRTLFGYHDLSHYGKYKDIMAGCK